MERNKLIIRARNVSSDAGGKLVRIDCNAMSIIDDLKRRTGYNEKELASTLIAFAANYVEVKYD